MRDRDRNKCISLRAMWETDKKGRIEKWVNSDQ